MQVYEPWPGNFKHTKSYFHTELSISCFSDRTNSDALRIRKDVAKKIEEIDAVVQVHYIIEIWWADYEREERLSYLIQLFFNAAERMLLSPPYFETSLRRLTAALKLMSLQNTITVRKGAVIQGSTFHLSDRGFWSAILEVCLLLLLLHFCKVLALTTWFTQYIIYISFVCMKCWLFKWSHQFDVYKVLCYNVVEISISCIKREHILIYHQSKSCSNYRPSCYTKNGSEHWKTRFL